MEAQPFFSIIIPTRNRPVLFKEAIESVCQQVWQDKEIIVVNDGSDDDFIEAYQAILDALPVKVRWEPLIQRKIGHGQSYSMNHGASLAQGQYLCFLDDDDHWTDPQYLTRAQQSLSQATASVDLYYSNQKAYFSDGRQQHDNVWLEDVIPLCQGRAEDKQGVVAMDAALLLQSRGFAHLNCSIFRRDFYLSINGMDENIRYECDRDIYIRSIDAAQYILYDPRYISYHNIPDKNNKTNMSTLVSDFEKRLYQLRVYEKGMLLSQQPALSDFCTQGKMYQLKMITESLVELKRFGLARRYAKEALAISYSFKWWLFTLYISMRSVAHT